MNIFRQLRWKLTLSYTGVTVSAFLVVVLIVGGIVFSQIFIPVNILAPTGLLEIIRNNSTPLWRHVLSQSPVDTDLVDLLLNDPNGTITSFDFFRIGAVQFSVRTTASLRAVVIGPDGILLGTTDHGFPPHSEIGQVLDTNQVPGLEAPLRAALAGETDAKRLYTILQSNKRFLLAIPVLNHPGGEVVGVLVPIFETFPTQGDIPWHILYIAGRSLLLFLLGTGIMGAIFGAITANGLATRFKRLSTTTEAWSAGDFSRFIDDSTGDEIARFAQGLNNMARQMQGLLRKRQDMAVSEERNRLARDLHDSAKQQALAASFHLGTALTLFDRDLPGAKKHLVEADTLVDSVRKELTNLVLELRPQSMDGQGFSDVLREYAIEWSRHSGIELKDHIEPDAKASLETRETLFRIAQEALANIARHSSAHDADVCLESGTSTLTLTIEDDGRGFDLSAPHSGLGLYSMRERAEALGGSFAVESAPGRGTKVAITLPKGN